MSDAFLSSMTFASHDFRSGWCDCDECEKLPAPILAALRQRKRQRLSEVPIKRTQVRTLTRRQDRVSVWNWILPREAEPIVEFGSSHRLVWIQRLPGKLRSVGKGIIGSSDEEVTRKDMDWQEGNIYLVPSNGGKAVGWVHVESPDTSLDETINAGGHTVLHIAKVPVELQREVKFLDETIEAVPNWMATLLQLCRQGLKRIDKDDTSDTPKFYKYSKEEYSELTVAFRQAGVSETDSLASNATPKKSEDRIQPEAETAPAASTNAQ